MDRALVQFVKHYPPYNPGDIADFCIARADQLVDQGYGKRYTRPKPGHCEACGQYIKKPAKTVTK